MKTQIPYTLVLFPRTDSSVASQMASVDLADAVSRIGKSDIYNIEVMDFEYDYTIFTEDKTLESNQKNEAFFIELFKDKIFKPGIVTFIANFDMGDLLLIMTQFEIHKPDLKVLLVITKSEFQKWHLSDRSQNIDCCVHEGVPSKSMMDMLGLIGKDQ